MAVLVVALKCICWVVVFAVTAILIVLALPISMSASGCITVEDNTEQVLRMLDAEDPGEIGLFVYDYTLTLKCRALLGLVAARMSDSTGSELRILGIRVPLDKAWKAGTSGKPRKSEPPNWQHSHDCSRSTGSSGESPKTDDTKTSETPSEGNPDNPRQDNRKGKKIRLSEIKQYLSPGVRARVIGLLKSLFKAFHLDSDLDIELGLFDPSHTGMVFGLFSAFAGSLGISGVRLRPNFEDQGIAAQGRVSMWMVPLHVVLIGARFMLAPEIRELWWKKRNSTEA
jgi:hypothetical protein